MTEPAYELVGNDKRKYAINPTGLTIGSASSNDVVIKDSQVSGTHARILFSRGRLWVRDDNTQTGIYINGQKVAGQQELRLGDELKIGSATFHLEKLPSTLSIQNRSKRGIIFISIATCLLFLLILLIGSSGVIRNGMSLIPTTTNTLYPTSTNDLVITSLPTPQATVLVISKESIATPTPSYGASIFCEDLDQEKDIHTCVVTNKGSTLDTLWLSFEPHRLDNTNDFNLSIILKKGENAVSPDRKGLISVGDFDPGMQKTIVLQMICVDIRSGCQLTTIKVQLLANNGSFPISSTEGTFSIKNIAIGKTATPTEISVRETQSTLPTISPPTLTSTPSDKFGPTATP